MNEIGNSDRSEPNADVPVFGDGRDVIWARASAAGVESEWTERRTEEGNTVKTLALFIPNGREKRKLPVLRSAVDDILQCNFEHWTALSDYAAFLDREDRVIEASVRMPLGARWIPQILPGVIQDSHETPPLEEDETLDESAGIAGGGANFDPDKPWRLPVEGTGVYSVEFSPPTLAMQVFERGRLRRPISPNRHATLKIRNVTVERHDDALSLLEGLSSALFFEIDLLHGALLQLVREDRSSRQLRSTRRREIAVPIKLPRMQYAQEATALYEYGRTAVGTPLLEFLAFYQVIEYFFPLFSRAETLRRLRRQLADPRFDLYDDSQLNQILAIASQSPRGFGGERDQLKDTLDAVIEDTELRAFIGSDEEREKFLTEGKKLKDVRVINPRDAGTRLTRQAADRVYDLRCRIVHTKEDGGSSGGKMIVPGSNESKILSHDIDLVQFLAQKVIIAGARRAPW